MSSPRLFNKFTLVLFVLSSFVYGEGDGDKSKYASYQQIKKPFAAKLVRQEGGSVTSQIVTRVILTPHGSKLFSRNMFNAGEEGVYIQNFTQESAWVVKPGKRIYASTAREKEDEETESDNFSMGIMSTVVCPDLSQKVLGKKKLEETTQGGRNIEVWECRYDGFQVKQHYSVEYGVVVREEWPPNLVVSLEEMTEVDYPEDFFVPPETYLEVSLEEFYTGAGPLSDYE